MTFVARLTVQRESLIINDIMEVQRIKPDFFFDVTHSGDVFEMDTSVFKQSVVEDALRMPLPGIDDLALFDGIVKLAHEDLTEYGTSGHNRLDNNQIELLFRVAARVGVRCGVDFPKLPFRNFTGFHAYWKKNDMSNSWAARRDYLNEAFQAVEDAIYDAQDRLWDETLADAVSPHGATGWPLLDAEIAQMRRKFARATTDQDHADVGNACVRVLEMLSDVAFDSEKYAIPGKPVPTKAQTKIRLELIVKKELPAADFEHAFKLSSAAIELAQRVKHSPAPSRREAGVSADTTILLVNIIRRITQDEQ